jgi:3-oxoacyl-[acyl-carrier protein] reductase
MGVVGLTKTVAKEWGQFNIRCNALVYGTIKTRCAAALSPPASALVPRR